MSDHVFSWEERQEIARRLRDGLRKQSKLPIRALVEECLTAAGRAAKRSQWKACHEHASLAACWAQDAMREKEAA